MTGDISRGSTALGEQHLLESQLRECFGRVAYSHKTHEKCADFAIRRLERIKAWQITLSAITTGGLLALLFGPNNGDSIAAGISAVMSTALLALNTYTKENDLGQSSQLHKETAAKLWSIRESYLSLLTDVKSGAISVEAARERRDALQTELGSLYEAAPRTSAEAYKQAQQALKFRGDLTFTDEEIDQFLPNPLRRTQQ